MEKPSFIGKGHALFLSFLLLPCMAPASVPGDQHWDNQFGAVGAGDALNSVTTGGGKVFVGGILVSAGNTKANSIAGYDGTNWFALNNGILGSPTTTFVYSMAWDGTNLYAGGWFTNADGSGARNLARWDGANWWPMGGSIANNPNSIVEAVKIVGTNIYAGGLFTTNGGVTVNGIAKWNGANWSAVGSAAPGMLPSSGSTQVKAMAEYSGILYAGGSFTNIGGVTASKIAQWDGNNWTQMGSGLNGTVFALCVHRGVLFAGGSFTGNGSGTVSLHGIAQWTGSDWADVPLIEIWRANNVVNAMISDGTYLYVGGNYYIGWGYDPTYPNTGADVYNLGYWDGSFWWPIGAQPGNTVSALALGSGKLYAGGSFTTIGGISASRIAQWNGTAWSTLGTGMNSGSVSAMGLIGSALYVTGSFTNAGNTNAQGIAKWDGSNWSALGSGLYFNVLSASGTGHSLATSGNDVYAGGLFSFAGDKPAMFIGHWNDQSNYYPTPHLQLTKAIVPSTNQFRFRVAGTSGENYTVLSSSNLTTWVPVLTNSATLFDYTVTNASASPKQYFRAVLGP